MAPLMDIKVLNGAILFSVVGILLGVFVSLWVELGFGVICLILWALYLNRASS